MLQGTLGQLNRAPFQLPKHRADLKTVSGGGLGPLVTVQSDPPLPMRALSEEDKLKYASMLQWGGDVGLDHIDTERERALAASDLTVAAPSGNKAGVGSSNAELSFQLDND